MGDRCRIVIEAVLKYAQELLGSNTNLNLPADLKVCLFLSGIAHRYLQFLCGVDQRRR